MDKPNYIINEVLNPLLDGCKPVFRDNTLYLELDNNKFWVNISYNDKKGLDDCDVWRDGVKFDLTDLQEEKIRIKAMHLHDDELKNIKENGIDINNY
jgi:hypothetical protein